MTDPDPLIRHFTDNNSHDHAYHFNLKMGTTRRPATPLARNIAVASLERQRSRLTKGTTQLRSQAHRRMVIAVIALTVGIPLSDGILDSVVPWIIGYLAGMGLIVTAMWLVFWVGTVHGATRVIEKLTRLKILITPRDQPDKE